MTIVSFNPRTGEVNGATNETPAADVSVAVERACRTTSAVAAAPPQTRRAWLHAIGESLEAHAADLVRLAEAETALGVARLEGELARAAAQLRFYGDVAAEGSYLGVAIDDARGDQPALARVNEPLGTVAVFGASNFPFAFGVLGNDVASALAAGCPVVAKAHPAHPLLSERLVELAREALRTERAPADALELVAGHEAGRALVMAAQIAAVAFTGSQAGGIALWRLANQRDVVIPVFAEMGTVNPVILTPAAAKRLPEIASGFVGSYTLGSGQFCTKPGLLLAPEGVGAAQAVGAALAEAAPQPTMLTSAIAEGVRTGLEALQAAGADVVERVPAGTRGWSAPAAVLTAPAKALVRGSRLLGECFGAVALVVEYADREELTSVVRQLQGSLAGSVFTALEGPDEDAEHAISLLAGQVGRVAVNNWPTGVAFTWAQQHGGPWPATSHPAATSVGAAALDRFVRPVTYQSTRDEWLPLATRAANPWRLPRRHNGRLVLPEGAW